MEELMHSSKDQHLICSYSIGFWKQCYHNHVRRVEHQLLDASINASAPAELRDGTTVLVWFGWTLSIWELMQTESLNLIVLREKEDVPSDWATTRGGKIGRVGHALNPEYRKG